MIVLLTLLILWVNNVAARKRPPNILFLMADEMDGRVVDPTSPISKMVKTPFFDSLAKEGANFIRTYSPSPQCVPSRTAMATGRRTDQIRCFANGVGLAASPNGTLDEECLIKFDHHTCSKWKKEQGSMKTFYDSMGDSGLDVELIGKIDVGANLLARYGPNSWATGFTQGPALNM